MEIILPNTLELTVHGHVGRGVRQVRVDDQGNLLFTMTDGSVTNLGKPDWSPTLDTTLTQAGQVAEAQATGAAISQVDAKAQGAQTTASQATETAQEAQTTANQANTAAQHAQTTADQANTAAQQAQTTANQANTAAQQAQQLAQTTQASLGNLNDLATNETGTLVGAINELSGRTGSGGPQWTWISLSGQNLLSFARFPAATPGTMLMVMVREISNNQIHTFHLMASRGLSFQQATGDVFVFPLGSTTFQVMVADQALQMSLTSAYQTLGVYYATF